MIRKMTFLLLATVPVASYVVYCGIVGRSGKALMVMGELGFSEVSKRRIKRWIMQSFVL